MKGITGIIISTTLITWLNISAAIPNESENSIENNHPITIYCIGNHDATGNCFSGGEDFSKSSDIDCVISSWPIVNCKNMGKEAVANYSCIALANTNIQNQISLSCEISKPVVMLDTNKLELNDLNKSPISPVPSDISDETPGNESNFFGEAFQ